LAFLETVQFMLHALTFVMGILIVAIILKVYNLYQVMKINRSVMTPMLFAGFFIALAELTELIASHFAETGEVVHTVAMFLAAVFFVYGIYGYHQMLNKAVKLR